ESKTNFERKSKFLLSAFPAHGDCGHIIGSSLRRIVGNCSRYDPFEQRLSGGCGMIQNLFELPRSHPMTLIFRPAEQAIRVEEESIAVLKIDRCFSECRSSNQAQWRRHRSDGFCCAIVMNNQKRWVACPDDLSLPGCGIQGNTHRCHE